MHMFDGRALIRIAPFRTMTGGLVHRWRVRTGDHHCDGREQHPACEHKSKEPAKHHQLKLGAGANHRKAGPMSCPHSHSIVPGGFEVKS